MDRFYFFSRSADKPPGKGTNEYLNSNETYNLLRRTPHWRRMLSNFWVSPFEMDGRRYNTVEHAFQAYKLALADPKKALELTLDSGSLISKGDGDAARGQRKAVILSDAQLESWEEIKDAVLINALYAKFSQHPELASVLVATNTAELYHGARGIPPQRQVLLEQVRTLLTSALESRNSPNQ